MQNFESFLASLASGDEPDVSQLVRKKKNAPPPMTLLPSEQAMSDMHEGATAAMSHEAGGGAGAMAAAAGGGLLKGIEKATQNVQPTLQVPFTQGNPIRDAAIGTAIAQPPPMQLGNEYDQMWRSGSDAPYRGLAYGGEIDDGEIVRVGNEWVKKTKDGRTYVIPNPSPDVQAQDADKERVPYTPPGGMERFQRFSGQEPIVPTDSGRTPPPMSIGDNEATEPAGQTEASEGERVVLQPRSVTDPDVITKAMDSAQALDRSRLGSPPPMQVSDPNDINSLYAQYAQNLGQKPNKWKEAGYGALQGAANFLTHQNNPIQSYNDVRIGRKNAPILAKIGAIEHQQEFKGKQAHEKALTDTIYADDLRQRDELLRKRDKDAAVGEYQTNLINLGKEKADNIKAYRDQIIDLKTRGADQNDARIKILQKRIDEQVRHNKVTEGQGGKKIDNSFKLGQLRIAAQKELKLIQEAGADRRQGERIEDYNKRQQSAIDARERLLKIKLQADGLMAPDTEPEVYGPPTQP